MRWWVKLLLQLSTPLLLLPLLGYSPAARCGYVVILMGVYWTFELLPLPVTSLLPVILFPLLGIASTNQISVIYMKGTNMMYLGSLMMALAVEESGLHLRIALKALLLAGTTISRIMVGFMIPTAFLSMWISNAATTAMMLPILEAVMAQLSLTPEERGMMLLCVAFSANIGGTGTVIGTPPNMILFEFLGVYEGHPLNFGSWLGFSLPMLVINLVLVFAVLNLYYRGRDVKTMLRTSCPTDHETGVKNLLAERYNQLGKITFQEKSVLSLFSLLVGLWFFRSPGFMPGWAELLEWKNKDKVVGISPATPTILILTVLFLIPRNPTKDPNGPKLLEWSDVQRKFPWGIILLMGGGFALAEGARISCLSNEVGSVMSRLSVLPTPLILLIFCLVTSIISQIASNSATASMLIPVVLQIGSSIQVNPLLLALGVTMTASNAFMLPVSTPSNAIVYTAGGIRIRDMVLVGAVLNLLCLTVTLASLYTHGSLMFSLAEFPAWANTTVTTQSQCVVP